MTSVEPGAGTESFRTGGSPSAFCSVFPSAPVRPLPVGCPSAAGSSPVRRRFDVASPSARRLLGVVAGRVRCRYGPDAAEVRGRSGALAGAGPVVGRGPAGCRNLRAGRPVNRAVRGDSGRLGRVVRLQAREEATATVRVRRAAPMPGPGPRRPAPYTRPYGRRAEPRPDMTVREAPHASRTVRRPRGLKAAVSPSPLVPLPAGRPTRFSWKTSGNPPARAHGRAHGHTPGARAPPLRPGAGTAAAPRRRPGHKGGTCPSGSPARAPGRAGSGPRAGARSDRRAGAGTGPSRGRIGAESRVLRRPAAGVSPPLRTRPARRPGSAPARRRAGGSGRWPGRGPGPVQGWFGGTRPDPGHRSRRERWRGPATGGAFTVRPQCAPAEFARTHNNPAIGNTAP